jgi:dTDP-4-amino-4,6-dideoxygalactose transaminase
MTEFQGALLLSKLKSYQREAEIKHSNGEYLAEKLQKIRGIDPLRRDPRITQRGYYFFVIRYDPNEFNGLPKERFVAALRAEGIPAGVGYGMPLYKQPAFRKEKLRDIFPKGAQLPDYESLFLPNSEEFAAREVTLPHPILLGDREALDLVVGAFEKIKANVDELL